MVGKTLEFQGEGYSIHYFPAQGRTLVLEGLWTSAIEAALTTFEVNCLALNYALGYKERNLEFLHEGVRIRRLSLLSRTTEDLTPVYRLGSVLEHIDVQASTRATLDLTRLPMISSVSAAWSMIRETVPLISSLRKLWVSGYTEDNLHPLGVQLSLSDLMLKDRPYVVSLAGLEFLPNLAELNVRGARRLMDLSRLEALAPGTLKSLQIEYARHIDSLDAIRFCPGLEFLNVSNLGTIDSLAPLAELQQLQRLFAYEATTVADGDLSPLARLPQLREVRMMSRKHYKPSLATVKEQIAARDLRNWKVEIPTAALLPALKPLQPANDNGSMDVARSLP